VERYRETARWYRQELLNQEANSARLEQEKWDVEIEYLSLHREHQALLRAAAGIEQQQRPESATSAQSGVSAAASASSRLQQADTAVPVTQRVH
jgi:hypothetical protein